MPLDLASLHACVFLQLPLRGVESVAKRHVNVFVRLLVVVLATYDDVLVGHAQVDADMIEITLLLIAMLCLHCNLAGDDMLEELLQLRRFFAYLVLDGIRMGKAAKRNL